jgi:hypothetical protein
MFYLLSCENAILQEFFENFISLKTVTLIFIFIYLYSEPS